MKCLRNNPLKPFFIDIKRDIWSIPPLQIWVGGNNSTVDVYNGIYY